MPTIRALGPDDAPAYSKLRLEALEGEPLAFGSAAEDHRLLRLEEIAGRLRDVPDGDFMLGTFIEGALVGTVGFARSKRPKDRHIGGVVAMYVTPSAQGQGIGRGLLSALLDRVRGYPDLLRVNLGVATHAAAARALYRSLGFVPFGVEPQAIRYEGRYADVELMSLALREA